MSKNKKDQYQSCSFCGKPAEMAKKIISGPGVHICDECVELRNRIMNQEEKKDEKKELALKSVEKTEEIK